MAVAVDGEVVVLDDDVGCDEKGAEVGEERVEDVWKPLDRIDRDVSSEEEGWDKGVVEDDKGIDEVQDRPDSVCAGDSRSSSEPWPPRLLPLQICSMPLNPPIRSR